MGGREDPHDLSFQDRLNELRKRRAPETVREQGAPAADDIPVMRVVLRAGTEMVSALVVGVVIGWGLDHWLGTRALFLVLFALLGGVAGVLNVWRLVRPRDDITS